MLKHRHMVTDEFLHRLVHNYKNHINQLRMQLMDAYKLQQNNATRLSLNPDDIGVELTFVSFNNHLEDLENQLDSHKKALKCLSGDI